jgi:hypothetical protein
MAKTAIQITAEDMVRYRAAAQRRVEQERQMQLRRAEQARGVTRIVTRKALAQRIRLEVDELDQIVAAVMRHWERVGTVTEDQDAFLNSVAVNLHCLYNGLERIMESVAIEMDGGTLGGKAWPSELLNQMFFELPGTRPALLSTKSAHSLDEYREFRHRVWNIYTTHLAAGRMDHLVERLPAIWQQVRSELRGFADFLDQLEAHV